MGEETEVDGGEGKDDFAQEGDSGDLAGRCNTPESDNEDGGDNSVGDLVDLHNVHSLNRRLVSCEE